jgi:hypothetical protein
MKFKPLDVVTSAPGWRPGVFVITEVDLSRPKNQYNAISLVNGKAYRLSDGGLASKRVGVADPEWNKTTIETGAPGDSVTVDDNWVRGNRRAQREVEQLRFAGNVLASSGMELKRWEKLLSLKPGDKFQCKVRGKLDTMTFRYVTDRGYKFVFIAENGNGTRYKYPLSVVEV